MGNVGRQMKVKELITIKNNDIQVPRNTYLTPAKAYNGFIRGELIFVRRFESNNAIIFRPMDGKEYTIAEDKLKNFKLTGR